MRFRFVHAADLHLDSPMRGLGARNPRLAALFADATRRAFEALVDKILALEAAFLIIAGDVYDGDWRDHGTGLFFARQLSRLSRAGIPVVLIRGNHDAESQITRSLILPEGVTTFSARKGETLLLDRWSTALHGRSFAERAVAENLVPAYPAAKPGWLNIGVLHTSADGRPDHAPYAPCSLADLKAKGYDYWALGHIHAHEILAQDPLVVFPGNIQGRHIRETGPKGAMLVEVSDGQVVGAERLIVDVARWARLAVDVAGAPDIETATRRVEAVLAPALAEAEGRPLALRITLTGTTPAHRRFAAERAQLEAEIAAALDRASDQAFLEKLVLETRAPAGEGAAGRPGRDDGDVVLDPALLLAEAERDPALAVGLDAALADIAAKLPEEVRLALAGLEGEDRARLVAEARDLALGRLMAVDRA